MKAGSSTMGADDTVKQKKQNTHQEAQAAAHHEVPSSPTMQLSCTQEAALPPDLEAYKIQLLVFLAENGGRCLASRLGVACPRPPGMVQRLMGFLREQPAFVVHDMLDGKQEVFTAPSPDKMDQDARKPVPFPIVTAVKPAARDILENNGAKGLTAYLEHNPQSPQRIQVNPCTMCRHLDCV